MTAILVVMTKQPLAGTAKTRLIPQYGEKGAAAIAGFLLAETVANARQYWPGDMVLSVAPDCCHPLIQSLCDDQNLECRSQGGGNLGQRMCREIDLGLMHHDLAVVIGADAPHVLPEVLPRVWREQHRHTAVIGPAMDGGYYLLGLAENPADLFSDIAWGGNTVFDVTCRRLQKAGIMPLLLPAAQDVDNVGDIREVCKIYADLQTLLDEIKSH